MLSPSALKSEAASVMKSPMTKSVALTGARQWVVSDEQFALQSECPGEHCERRGISPDVDGGGECQQTCRFEASTSLSGSASLPWSKAGSTGG